MHLLYIIVSAVCLTIGTVHANPTMNLPLNPTRLTNELKTLTKLTKGIKYLVEAKRMQQNMNQPFLDSNKLKLTNLIFRPNSYPPRKQPNFKQKNYLVLRVNRPQMRPPYPGPPFQIPGLPHPLPGLPYPIPGLSHPFSPLPYPHMPHILPPNMNYNQRPMDTMGPQPISPAYNVPKPGYYVKKTYENPQEKSMEDENEYEANVKEDTKSGEEEYVSKESDEGMKEENIDESLTYLTMGDETERPESNQDLEVFLNSITKNKLIKGISENVAQKKPVANVAGYKNSYEQASNEEYSAEKGEYNKNIQDMEADKYYIAVKSSEEAQKESEEMKNKYQDMKEEVIKEYSEESIEKAKVYPEAEKVKSEPKEIVSQYDNKGYKNESTYAEKEVKPVEKYKEQMSKEAYSDENVSKETLTEKKLPEYEKNFEKYSEENLKSAEIQKEAYSAETHYSSEEYEQYPVKYPYIKDQHKKIAYEKPVLAYEKPKHKVEVPKNIYKPPMEDQKTYPMKPQAHEQYSQHHQYEPNMYSGENLNEDSAHMYEYYDKNEKQYEIESAEDVYGPKNEKKYEKEPPVKMHSAESSGEAYQYPIESAENVYGPKYVKNYEKEPVKVYSANEAKTNLAETQMHYQQDSNEYYKESDEAMAEYPNDYEAKTEQYKTESVKYESEEKPEAFKAKNNQNMKPNESYQFTSSEEYSVEHHDLPQMNNKHEKIQEKDEYPVYTESMEARELSKQHQTYSKPPAVNKQAELNEEQMTEYNNEIYESKENVNYNLDHYNSAEHMQNVIKQLPHIQPQYQHSSESYQSSEDNLMTKQEHGKMMQEVMSEQEGKIVGEKKEPEALLTMGDSAERPEGNQPLELLLKKSTYNSAESVSDSAEYNSGFMHIDLKKILGENYQARRYEDSREKMEKPYKIGEYKEMNEHNMGNAPMNYQVDNMKASDYIETNSVENNQYEKYPQGELYKGHIGQGEFKAEYNEKEMPMESVENTYEEHLMNYDSYEQNENKYEAVPEKYEAHESSDEQGYFMQERENTYKVSSESNENLVNRGKGNVEDNKNIINTRYQNTNKIYENKAATIENSNEEYSQGGKPILPLKNYEQEKMFESYESNEYKEQQMNMENYPKSNEAVSTENKAKSGEYSSLENTGYVAKKNYELPKKYEYKHGEEMMKNRYKESENSNEIASYEEKAHQVLQKLRKYESNEIKPNYEADSYAKKNNVYKSEERELHSAEKPNKISYEYSEGSSGESGFNPYETKSIENDGYRQVTGKELHELISSLYGNKNINGIYARENKYQMDDKQHLLNSFDEVLKGYLNSKDGKMNENAMTSLQTLIKIDLDKIPETVQSKELSKEIESLYKELQNEDAYTVFLKVIHFYLL